MKAVDGVYPLYGEVTLDPPISLAAATAQRDGHWGAAADENLIARLDLKIGDELKIGDAGSTNSAPRLPREPDRGSGIFILGPRLMVADGSLESTGLVQPGSLIYYLYRMKLPPEVAAADWLKALKEDSPTASGASGIWTTPPPARAISSTAPASISFSSDSRRCWSAASASAMRCAAICRARPRRWRR